ncbi:MarR family winged helix-turn-helix transcriptional regulator [Microlunatus sp. Y2014]|uniref:MarR family winged helix-turn-helix transcriptional regulator n=1 Tax=Microlunatus sp. Y2014 TaxID=3418488 RepID=UPI003DA6EA4B
MTDDSGGRQGDDLDLGSLLHRSFRRLRRSWVEQLAPWDLTPFQWRALSHVTQCDDGLRLKHLADRLHIAPRSATEVVDQLETKGLVVRGADASDRRAVVVTPTGRGRELADAIRQERRESSAEYFSVLTASQQAALADLLTALADAQPDDSA